MSTRIIQPGTRGEREKVLLQTGGEGAVYAKGGKALKVYHRPSALRSQKLHTFVSQGLQRQLPPSVLGPQRLIVAAPGLVTGFEMALLPPTARPWKKLSQPLFCRQHDLSLARELDLLLRMHGHLQAIHDAGVVVGDLNDHNIFFDLGGGEAQECKVFWIDVDSFQFGGFPCPVALVSFLDPLLYDAGDFASAPLFSRDSDWYAYAVLACKTLLKVHPYGGAHHGLKTLQARASAGISVLHPSVTYPGSARLPGALDDNVRARFRAVFEAGQRGVFPADLLRELRQNLTQCTKCAQEYAASRTQCPACRRPSTRVIPATVQGSLRVRLLLAVDGEIVQVFVQASGRLVAVTRKRGAGDGAGLYSVVRLGPGGVLDETVLFGGAAGARFGLMQQDVLVVNAPWSRKLMLLILADGEVRPITTVESSRFRGEAVFATTPQALYRIAQGAILRGQVRRGALLEEIVATAHEQRTKLWASPQDDIVAGYHHLFAEHHFFLLDPARGQISLSPETPPEGRPRSVSDVDVAWGPGGVAFLWHESGGGRVKQHWQVVDTRGVTQHAGVADATQAPFDRLDGKVVNGNTVLHPTEHGALKVRAESQALLDDAAPYCSQAATLLWHREGLLVVEGGRLVLMQTG